MKWLALLKQFPKYALVLVVVVGSTVLFAFWWFTHSPAKSRPFNDTAVDQAAIQRQAAKAEARIGYLFLADSDLYDAGTGELLSKNWLEGDAPLRLFYDSQARKILGEYPQGFARYGFDGTREATMMLPQSPPAMIPGRKQVVFAKEKNIWIADIDWQKFEFTNQRQVTTMGVFYEQHFAENVQLLTSKTLLVRNMNNLLRVNLENGEVHPSRLPLGGIGKRRSPDSRWVAGFVNGQFYCYDVDADMTKTIPVGRNGFSDFQWIGNNKCICLAARQEIVAYDRPSHTLPEIAILPFACFKIGEPSPDGRFIFATGGLDGRNGALVDLERKMVTEITGGLGVTWVDNDAFAYSREISDSGLRGTWLQTAGQPEKRISLEPYLVHNGGPQLIVLSFGGLTLISTKNGVTKMTTGSSELNDCRELTRRPAVLRTITKLR